MSTTAVATGGPPSADRAAVRSAQRTSRRPTRTANSTTSARCSSAPPTCPADRPLVAMADTSASRSQPTASSTMPAVRVSWPMSRCSSFMSASVLAMTGMALTDIATPTKNAKVTRSPPSATSAAGASRPAEIPSASGRTSPKALIRSAVPRRRAQPAEVQVRAGHPRPAAAPRTARCRRGCASARGRAAAASRTGPARGGRAGTGRGSPRSAAHRPGPAGRAGRPAGRAAGRGVSSAASWSRNTSRVCCDRVATGAAAIGMRPPVRGPGRAGAGGWRLPYALVGYVPTTARLTGHSASKAQRPATGPPQFPGRGRAPAGRVTGV